MFNRKRLGIKGKPRTLDAINKDYNEHAVKHGHNARVIAEIQQEQAQHIQRMLEINAEAKALPPVPQGSASPAPAAEPKSDGAA